MDDFPEFVGDERLGHDNTSSGVRTYGAIVYSAVTIASFFLVRFWPLPKRTGVVAVEGWTIGTPLPSACATKIVPSGVRGCGRGMFVPVE